MFPSDVCLKNYNLKNGHRACLRDMMGQTYPIYALIGTSQTGSSCF